MEDRLDIEGYLNKGIREIITKFPKVADILNEYNIGCVLCNAGSCLLKDIVEIHNLSLEQERELLGRIFEIIYPGQKPKIPKIPKIKRKQPVKEGQINYSPPLKMLVDEHILIKRWLSFIPYITENLNLESKENKRLLLEGVEFIRNYADRFHHAKEEDILFEYTDKKSEIIQTMLSDHQTARSYVRGILEAIEKKDRNKISENLYAYKELLTEHIKKEDEILYPWIDRNLSITQVGELFNKFEEVDSKSEKEVIESCQKFIEKLEEKFTKSNLLKQEAVK